jgi:DNA-binding NarL/FixJ family response regulator
MPIRVIVIEPHALLRRALTAVLCAEPRFELVMVAADLPEAVRGAGAGRADVILLGASASWVGLASSIAILHARFRSSAVLVTGVELESEYEAVARGAGADGYVRLDAPAAELAAAAARASRRAPASASASL